MSTSSERAEQLHLVSRLRSAFPELPDAPTADMLDHPRIKAYLKPVHDVVGEPDAPLKYENKQYEQWEELTYIMCEVLGRAASGCPRNAAGSATSTSDVPSIWGCRTTRGG